MRIAGCIVAGFLFVAGCNTPAPHGDSSASTEAAMFGIESIRIHPVFSHITDWTDDGQIDGVEALVEFSDRFSDPTKGAGTILFELFEYREGSPDPRGRRVVNPWLASIQTVEQQRAHWNNTTQTYEFKLAWPQIHQGQLYVLTATFTATTGERFFSRVILGGAQETSSGTATSQPASH